MAIATLTIDLVAKLASLERDMGKAAQIANCRRMDQAFSAVGRTLATLGAGLSVGAFAGSCSFWPTPATRSRSCACVPAQRPKSFRSCAMWPNSIAHCRTRLAAFQCPRSVEIRNQPLPVSGTGKIMKNELRKSFWREFRRLSAAACLPVQGDRPS